jgi:ubiquinone/menaquinone biosynthesis C-methylase UbiE
MYLHHCPNPLASIQEMVRVLKPGGRLTLTDMDSHPYAWLKSEMADVWQGFEREALRGWLAEAGLVNVLIDCSGESCRSMSSDSATTAGLSQAEISIFVATGTKRVRARDLVQAGYAARAESDSGCCSPSPESAQSSCCTPQAVISADDLLVGVPILPGYDAAEVASVPVETAGISLGCGNPTALADLQPGETVLDIGSGGGIDVFLAARKVGAQGKVIGVDMTPAMLERARRSAEKAGLANVEFRQGYAEALPAEDGTVDVIISNCVINLTEDKALAWREAYRVLKPGGRVEVSDVATDLSLPVHLRLDARGWAECVTGALPLEETVDLMKQTGFREITTRPSAQNGKIEGVAVFSTQFSARK